MVEVLGAVYGAVGGVGVLGRVFGRWRMGGPLAGVKVVELAGRGPGPFGAMLLADLGAEVVRVCRVSDVVPRRDPAKTGPRG